MKKAIITRYFDVSIFMIWIISLIKTDNKLPQLERFQFFFFFERTMSVLLCKWKAFLHTFICWHNLPLGIKQDFYNLKILILSVWSVECLVLSGTVPTSCKCPTLSRTHLNHLALIARVGDTDTVPDSRFQRDLM